ncbi:MAG: hypothetical protein ACYC7J_09425 [Syntrophales bacterium]
MTVRKPPADGERGFRRIMFTGRRLQSSGTETLSQESLAGSTGQQKHP